MVYCLGDDEVLLMHRHKEPDKGLWILPGGTIGLFHAWNSAKLGANTAPSLALKGRSTGNFAMRGVGNGPLNQ
jgi:hypothetical protein